MMEIIQRLWLGGALPKLSQNIPDPLYVAALPKLSQNITDLLYVAGIFFYQIMDGGWLDCG